MAQMFPDEGLDLILSSIPKSTAKPTSPYKLCLFTSQTASTVITHAQTIANITETTYTSYTRQNLAEATWGAIAERPTNAGRQTTYPEVTFPTVGTTGATINGFHITDNGVTKVFAQANFDDQTAVVLVTNDIIKVTPTWALLH